MSDIVGRMVAYRLERAHETLRESEAMIEGGFAYAAANRLYYACFYAVTALLLDRGIRATTHVGVRGQFALHFIKPGIVPRSMGVLYNKLFDRRIETDYADFAEVEVEALPSLLAEARAFVAYVERLLGEGGSLPSQ